MALIHDLIVLLDDGQLTSLQSLQITKRERQFLNFIIAARHKKIFPGYHAQQKLAMSKAYIEKASSILLKKALRHLAGNDPYTQFRFVKELTARPARLIRHQMKIAEALITDLNTKIKFLSDCCEIVTRLDTTELNNREIHTYTRKLLRLIDPDHNPELYIKVKCDELYAAISLAMLDLDINNENITLKLQARIKKLVREAAKINHVMATYQVLRLASIFYISVNEQQSAMHYIDRNIAHTVQFRESFSDKDWIEPRLMKAEGLSYLSRFRESYDLFCELIGNGRYNQQHLRLASQARFFKVCVRLGEYKKAKQILDNNFEKAMTHESSDLKVMACLQFSCYYLHLGLVDQAAPYLKVARQELNRQRQQQYHIQLLFFENCHLYLCGKYEEARITAEKNIKFLRSKNMKISNSPFPYLFYSIVAIYDLHWSRKPFNSLKQKAYDYCFTESFCNFGGVLQGMLQLKSGNTINHNVKLS